MTPACAERWGPQWTWSSPSTGPSPASIRGAARDDTSAAIPLDDARRTRLRAQVRLTVGITIAYNVLEGLISIAAGSAASSAALVGSGLDPFVEVLSAAAVAWQFTRTEPERYERATMRVIAVAFFALAAWVTFNAVLGLLGFWDAEQSPVGIAIALLSVIVMPALALWERHTGPQLGSATVVATHTRRCSPRPCRWPCLWGCSSTAASVGRGPTRWPPW